MSDSIYMRRLVTLIGVALAALPAPTFAWGDKGHEIIATIARDRLTPGARAWVDGILAQDHDTLTAPDMASRATWADKWRGSGHRETASWHFVDLEISGPDLKAACFGQPAPASPPNAGPAQDCVVNKIGEFAKELGDPATLDAERVLALKYVLHFVGDVHQPLHSSDNQDRGGNCVHVSLGGQRSTNLHSYWDTGVFSSLGDDPNAIAKTLEARISVSDAKRWAKGTAASWARETFGIARAGAYAIGSPSGCESDQAPINLTAAYQSKALSVAEVQVEKAGVRLAALLNATSASAGHPGR